MKRNLFTVGLIVITLAAKAQLTSSSFLFFNENRSNSSARNWVIRQNNAHEGDFQIGLTTTNTGSMPDLYLNPSQAVMTFSNAANIGLGTTAPVYRLDVVAPSDTWKARLQGTDGYILMGPANSGWAHIYTDRPRFLFNAGVTTMGPRSSFSADLSLQTSGYIGDTFTVVNMCAMKSYSF